MAGFRKFLRYWLPVILWASLLFSASTNAGSVQHTSRFLKPFLRWLIPGISEPTLNRVHIGVRKAAHVTEYAVFALLLLRGLRCPKGEQPMPWRWSLAAATVAVCFTIAATDEFWQTFWSTRRGAWDDVFLDTTGGTLGTLLYWAGGKLRGKW